MCSFKACVSVKIYFWIYYLTEDSINCVKCEACTFYPFKMSYIISSEKLLRGRRGEVLLLKLAIKGENPEMRTLR